MSKRILSLVLSLCLLCGMTTVALAAGEVSVNGAADYTFGDANSVNITAVVENADETKYTDVYSVEVVWGNMQFAWGQEYAEEKVWDPTMHVWKTNENYTAADTWYMVTTDPLTGEWTAFFDDTATQDGLMIFNHSSQPVDAAIEFTTGADNAEGIENTSIIPDYALENDYAFAPESRTVNDVVYEEVYHLKEATESQFDVDEETGTIKITKDNRYLDDGSHIRGLVTLTDPEGTDFDVLSEEAKVIAKLTVVILKAE